MHHWQEGLHCTVLIAITANYRRTIGLMTIMQNCRLVQVERNFKDHLVLPCLAMNRNTFCYQVVQSSIQPALEYFQGWGSHNSSGQPLPLSHHLHNKEYLLFNIFLITNPNLLFFSLKLLPFSLPDALMTSPSPVCFQAPIRCQKADITSPWSLLQAEQYQLSQHIFLLRIFIACFVKYDNEFKLLHFLKDSLIFTMLSTC